MAEVVNEIMSYWSLTGNSENQIFLSVLTTGLFYNIYMTKWGSN